MCKSKHNYRWWTKGRRSPRDSRRPKMVDLLVFSYPGAELSPPRWFRSVLIIRAKSEIWACDRPVFTHKTPLLFHPCVIAAVALSRSIPSTAPKVISGWQSTAGSIMSEGLELISAVFLRHWPSSSRALCLIDLRANVVWNLWPASFPFTCVNYSAFTICAYTPPYVLWTWHKHCAHRK